MTSRPWDIAVIGGGIVGLSAALNVIQLYPKTRVAVLEKETEVGLHQTGHNSGVIHSGVYYRPGSQKARFCVSGVQMLKSYCHEKGIEYDECGKVIVATDESELPRLEELRRRGRANGVDGLEMIGPERLAEIEPHVRGVKALRLPKTAVVDYRRVAHAYAEDIQESGGEILTGRRLRRVGRNGGGVELDTGGETIEAKHVINCAGLYADRVARMMGADLDVRIVPFRGEYYTLRPESRGLVKGMIYPTPDPRFPFLGVHYTRGINGEVEAGPNAVLAWSREGYRKTVVNARDAIGTFAYVGFWRMTLRTWRVGLAEMRRSLVKSVFVKDLRKLLPEIRSEDLAPGGAGVRAQAVSRQGALLDDFCIEESRGAIHVLNAPSPGATSSLSIGRHIAERAGKSFGLKG